MNQLAANLDLLSADTKRALCEWLGRNENFTASTLAKGYQGKIALFEYNEKKYVIKAALGKSITSWLLVRTLQHEFKVYQQLSGIEGIPKCYGLIQGRYLVLEYIAGQSLREITPDKKTHFFAGLLQIVQSLHNKGIAHMDMKRKDNILVHEGSEPYLIDFGVAVIYKPGLHPLNHYLFRLAKQFDLNAWVKHKYERQIDQVSLEDSRYFSRTAVESVAAAVKQFYKRQIKNRLQKTSTINKSNRQ